MFLTTISNHFNFFANKTLRLRMVKNAAICIFRTTFIALKNLLAKIPQHQWTVLKLNCSILSTILKLLSMCEHVRVNVSIDASASMDRSPKLIKSIRNCYSLRTCTLSRCELPRYSNLSCFSSFWTISTKSPIKRQSIWLYILCMFYFSV